MKPKDPIWNFFCAFDVKRRFVRCMDCNAVVSTKALDSINTMKTH